MSDGGKTSTSTMTSTCCISHEFFKLASENYSKVAVIHATGGLWLCKRLSELRTGKSDDDVEEQMFGMYKESSYPSVYRGDVCFTYGEILNAVDSLSRRIRRALDGEEEDPDVFGPRGNLHMKKSLNAQKMRVSNLFNSFPHIVGINIGPSVEYIVAVLSILKCGEAFLPLDPLWPKQRVTAISSSSGVALVIKCKAPFQSMESYQQDGGDWAVRCGCSVLCFSLTKSPKDNIGDSGLAWPCQAKNTRLFCYLMFTSGSTGEPKGVCGTEKGLLNRFIWMRELYPLMKDDVLLFKTSISFIDHIQEFLSAILTCTPLFIPQFNELKENSHYLIDIIKVYCISRLVTVPSLMRAVVPSLHNLKPLKLLMLSGETFSLSLWKLLYNQLPETTILNLYGTTEVSGDCTYFDCEKLPKLLEDEYLSSVPIGKPISNCDVICDWENQTSDKGEIKVGGSCLFFGYLGDNHHYLYDQNPETPLHFNTGDFAIRLQSGDLVFVGRKDRIVKVNGQRISLEEIEKTLREHPDVDDVAVTSHGNLSDPSYLRVHVVHKREKGNEEKTTSVDYRRMSDGLFCSIKSWLLEKLPIGFIPIQYFCVNQIPLSLTGKVDYEMLGSLACMTNEKVGYDEDEDFQDVLQIIRKVFSDALIVEEIKDQDDFFSLGGNSISAAQVAHKLGIDMRLIYHYPSPKELLSSLFKVSHNFKINLGKRLKRNEISVTDDGDPLRSLEMKKYYCSSFGSCIVDTSAVSGYSQPIYDAFWKSSFPNSSRCSFSRYNRFMDANKSILSHLSEARWPTKTSRKERVFLQKLWKVDLSSCVDASPLLVLKEGRMHLFIGSHSQLFVCVCALSGAVQWKVQLEGRIEGSAAVTDDFSQVVVGCYKGRIYFIDILNGHISWIFQTDGEVKTQPVVCKRLIWCGSHDHMLYALDHRKKCCIYKIPCGGSIYGSPSVDEIRNMLYVATTSGSLLAILVKALPFSLVWSFESGAPIFGSPCLHPSSGTVVCCLVNGHVFALDSKGSLIWKAITEGPIFAGLCHSSVLPSQVLICSRSGSIYSFDLEGGDLLWEHQFGAPITAAACVDEQIELISDNSTCSLDRLVCVCSSSGCIHVLRVSSSLSREGKQEEEHREIPGVEKIASLELPGDIFSSPVMIGGRIFIGCRDDHVYCVGIVRSVT